MSMTSGDSIEKKPMFTGENKVALRRAYIIERMMGSLMDGGVTPTTLSKELGVTDKTICEDRRATEFCEALWTAILDHASSTTMTKAYSNIVKEINKGNPTMSWRFFEMMVKVWRDANKESPIGDMTVDEFLLELASRQQAQIPDTIDVEPEPVDNETKP